MFAKILLWGAIIWFSFEILRRLTVSILLIFEGYSERGLRGAFNSALIALLFNLWDFFKKVFWIIFFIFILSLFVRGCGK
jgi:hypothetical protein